MNREILEDIINEINFNSNIDRRILEKDYYVCLILKELSTIQSELKAYFKGGTAVYKILDIMYRFSEDIDLTVKIDENLSNTSNRNRLKKSALGYDLDGLELDKSQTIDKKGSITTFYKYNSLFTINNLYKPGIVQIESTSFTVSEPTSVYTIEPLIYKYATVEQKKVLKDKYNICEFNIEIITLERIFVDKIFAIEFYYIRNMYKDVSKHLYDITILFKRDDIKIFLNNKSKLNKIIKYKRLEEKNRIGGIDSNLKIKNFSYLNNEINEELTKIFYDTQDIYVFDDKYKLNINEVKNTLKELYNYFMNY